MKKIVSKPLSLTATTLRPLDETELGHGPRHITVTECTTSFGEGCLAAVRGGVQRIGTGGPKPFNYNS